MPHQLVTPAAARPVGDGRDLAAGGRGVWWLARPVVEDRGPPPQPRDWRVGAGASAGRRCGPEQSSSLRHPGFAVRALRGLLLGASPASLPRTLRYLNDFLSPVSVAGLSSDLRELFHHRPTVQ